MIGMNLQHEAEYVYKSETELKLRKSLFDCPNKDVKADAELAWYKIHQSCFWRRSNERFRGKNDWFHGGR